MQRMEYLRDLGSSVADLPWTVASGSRRAARPVRRAGEALWSSVLDLPWLARDAWKRVEAAALGHPRSRVWAPFLAVVTVAGVLVLVSAVRSVASEPASTGLAGAATPGRQAVLEQAAPPGTTFEPYVRESKAWEPRIRAPLGGRRPVRTRVRRERLALIQRLAATARRPLAGRRDRD